MVNEKRVHAFVDGAQRYFPIFDFMLPAEFRQFFHRFHILDFLPPATYLPTESPMIP